MAQKEISMFKGLIIKIGLWSMLLGACLNGNAQSYTLKGTVMNSSHQKLENIAISYQGSGKSPVITDSIGEFEINVPSGSVWLNISSLGDYKSKNIYIDNRTNIDIVLVKQQQNSVYDEVLYPRGNKTKRNLISGTYSTKAGKMLANSNETFDQNIQGRVGGLYQVGLSGMPGSGTYMLLRGLNSINSTNQPLVVVDGMPLETPGVINSLVDGNAINPISSIVPMDISNLTIIKNGAALTSYGIKGSNGIIAIETLKPVDTETSIDFTYKTGVSIADRQIPQLQVQDYKTLAKEILSTSNYLEENYSTLYPGLFLPKTDDAYVRYNHNTNWQDEVFSNALLQDAHISVKGGDAIARYGLSIGFLDNKGIIKNTDFKRFSTRFVGTFNIFNWLRMYVSANLVSTSSTYKESALNEQTSPLLTALQKSPQLNPFSYDAEGNRLERIDEVEQLGVSNPRAVINSYDAKNSGYRFLTSFRVEGNISKNLMWNSLLGLNINDLKEKVFMPNHGMETYFNNEAYNVSQASNSILNTLYNDNYITFKKLINNIHFIEITGGARWQTNEFQNDIGIAMNSNENDQYTNLGAGDNQLRNIDGQNYKWNWLSNYYTLNYILKDKYLFEAALSADFSSRVGKNAAVPFSIAKQPFGLFYNVGAAWRLSQESFLKNSAAIEDLKLRVTYETSGNDDIGNLNALRYYKLKLYRETSGMIPGIVANEELLFETTKQLSVGLDLSILENRFNLSADYYSASINNVLIYDPLPSYLGDETYPTNNAAIAKSGYELSLNSRLIQNKNFAFDLNLSLSHSESLISSISNNKNITRLPGNIEIVNQKDKPVNSFYGYRFLGVFASSEEAEKANLVNETGIQYRAGDARFDDLNNDGVINENDKTIIGSATPDYFGGIGCSVHYKKLTLDVFGQFALGQEVANYLRMKNESMTDLSNQSTAVLNRWEYDRQETDIPHAIWNDPVGNSDFSTRWIEDGSYFRLKTVSLSYQIPDEVWKLKNLHIFITGTNLLTLTKYLSYDPEFGHSQSSIVQGVDYGLVPNSKRFTLGVKFGL